MFGLRHIRILDITCFEYFAFWILMNLFRVLDCRAPLDPTNGEYIYTITTFGSLAVLTCLPGYESDVKSVTCTEAGSWSQTPSCNPEGKTFNV